MRILLVEDDEVAARVLKDSLNKQHYSVELATDGEAGREMAEASIYDLILLDVILPKLDGISLCKQLRVTGNRAPILLLTAQDDSTGKVAGFDAGADDYVVKPYDLNELLARIRALSRRNSKSDVQAAIATGNLRLDPSSCQVTYNGQLLHFTAKEYALIELFLRHSDRIFSQSALLDRLWTFEEHPSENAVRAHIKSLRQKLKQAGAADPIETIRGMGYRLKAEQGRRELGELGELGEKSKIQNLKSKISLTPQQQSLAERMNGIWERFKDKFSDRVALLERAVADLAADKLEEPLRQQAQQQAHACIGSLGSLGFDAAARICREIEQTFRSTALDRANAAHLSDLVVALRQHLQQPPPATIKPPAPIFTSLEPQMRLLVVDDDAPLVQSIASTATDCGINTVVAYNLSQAREAIVRDRPNVVLLDLCFPNCTEDGFFLLEELSTQELSPLVLVFTATENFSLRVKAAKLGAKGFLQKPVSPDRVMQAIAQVWQRPAIPQGKLAIASAEPQILDEVRSLLSAWDFQLTLLDDVQQFWHALEQLTPDLVILDGLMSFSSIDLCQAIRNDYRWRELPVLCLCDRTNDRTVQQLYAAGASDYVNKPIMKSELIARILNQLKRQ